ncbi:hypothetical protein Hanom_Chr09g00795921 [Helianthus anomalus]
MKLMELSLLNMFIPGFAYVHTYFPICTPNETHIYASYKPVRGVGLPFLISNRISDYIISCPIPFV